MKIQHSFSDGKYTVIFDQGRLSALRNGQAWERDLIGDQLVAAMLFEVDNLKEELAQVKQELQTLKAPAN